ncbi:4-hydroxy-tetrahydrodipicolinate synthase [Gracilibacillus halotolerans]|uniref:4-hydroxy-tetrahydrodipicolinate synthase n=2 Tax=Gracilibacillus halotolerans TaxID=74386 RepID=A0A841RIK7_9BACI|nr:4-hydroxy-tetrahydrodipicolinate synthase [Gracilibacillus halotolerans]
MIDMDFGKVITAMVTPFNEDNQLDLFRTTELIEYLLENGTDGLVVAGTTGESPTLTPEEKIQLFEHVVQTVDGRVPVIAGTGSNNTQETIEFTKAAEAVGVDGTLLVTPYYNKPNQLGLLRHFETIAQNTQLPIMLYNIPSRSVVKMDTDTVVQLAEIDNIVSIKDSTGDLDGVAAIIEATDDNFSVYSGDDSLTLPLLSIGSKGVVSVASHIIGNDMKKMVDLFNAGSIEEAAALHRKIIPLVKALFMAPSPAPVKAALERNNLQVGSVRLPLVPLTNEEQSLLHHALNNYSK